MKTALVVFHGVLFFFMATLALVCAVLALCTAFGVDIGRPTDGMLWIAVAGGLMYFADIQIQTIEDLEEDS